MNGLQIWDIPRPPLLEDCHLWSGRTDQFTQFRTIDIQKTTGITLFLANGRAFAIHSHTVTMPCAKTTFERLFTSQQQRVAWAYIPIPAGDQIIAVGVPSQRAINKSGSCIMVAPSVPLRERPRLLILVYSRSERSLLVRSRSGSMIQHTLTTIVADSPRRFSFMR